MDNQTTENTYWQESPKLLEAKIKREDKNYPYVRKWKPYKYMSYDEKKRLADKESHRDITKYVFIFLKIRTSKITRNF
jgi:hypothetical protein